MSTITKDHLLKIVLGLVKLNQFDKLFVIKRLYKAYKIQIRRSNAMLNI